MPAGVQVLRVAFQRRAVATLGLFQFALLEINVAQLRVMMRFVEMMNLGLQFLDAPAIVRAGQLESARGRRGGSIDIEIIPKRAEAPAEEDEYSPKPFALPDRIHEHPNLECGNCQRPDVASQAAQRQQVREQRGQHGAEANAAAGSCKAEIWR